MFKIASVSAPDPAGEAYDAPPDPLVGRGFLPSEIAASRLRRLQFPRLTCLYAKNYNISCPEFIPSMPTAPRLFSPPICPTTWNPLNYALIITTINSYHTTIAYIKFKKLTKVNGAIVRIYLSIIIW